MPAKKRLKKIIGDYKTKSEKGSSTKVFYNTSHSIWRLKNRERLLEYNKKWRLLHLDDYKKYHRIYYKSRKDTILRRQKQYRENNEVIIRRRRAMRRRQESMRLEVLEYIGKRKCYNCGNMDPDVLTFDHIGDDFQRFASIYSIHLFAKNKDESIKKNLRVVCANCNLKIRRSKRE